VKATVWSMEIRSEDIREKRGVTIADHLQGYWATPPHISGALGADKMEAVSNLVARLRALADDIEEAMNAEQS